MTAENVLEGALGRIGVNTTVRLTSIETGESSAGAQFSVGSRSAGLRAGGQQKRGESQQVESVPVGQAPEDLGWAAEQLRVCRRRPVFEDFHNLASKEQDRMAFAIKALGEWGVPCVVVGIWTGHHLLTFYCGELDGRIEDLHVTWTGDELLHVLDRDCETLNVAIGDDIRAMLLRDAYTSVGLLQQLARAVLWEAGVRRRGSRRSVIDEGLYRRARSKVVESLSARFTPFIQNLPNTAGTHDKMIENVLWAVTAHLDEDALLKGVNVGFLSDQLTINDATATAGETLACLERLDGAHRALNVKPAVLAYDPARQSLILADRRFLLYRRLANRRWPWD
jgi:hypothetical protein